MFHPAMAPPAGIQGEGSVLKRTRAAVRRARATASVRQCNSPSNGAPSHTFCCHLSSIAARRLTSLGPYSTIGAITS